MCSSTTAAIAVAGCAAEATAVASSSSEPAPPTTTTPETTIAAATASSHCFNSHGEDAVAPGRARDLEGDAGADARHVVAQLGGVEEVVALFTLPGVPRQAGRTQVVWADEAVLGVGHKHDGARLPRHRGVDVAVNHLALRTCACRVAAALMLLLARAEQTAAPPATSATTSAPAAVAADPPIGLWF